MTIAGNFPFHNKTLSCVSNLHLADISNCCILLHSMLNEPFKCCRCHGVCLAM